MNNKRLNSERLVLKRQKETVYYRNIRLKRRKQDPSSQSPLSPKKEKIQDSRNLVEIDAQTRRRDANKTRLRVRRHPTLSFLSTKYVFIRKAIQNDVRVCVLFARPNFSFFAMKKNEMQRFSSRIRAFERKRDSSLSLSLSLSLSATKAYRMQCESQSTKKNVRNVPLYRRLNLLLVWRLESKCEERERETCVILGFQAKP